MTARWITLWFFLLLLHCSACPEQNDAAQWTAERFDGNLSGVTVTVTRRVWEQGPLTETGADGSPRPELIYALRCAEAAHNGMARARILRAGGWTAEIEPPDGETAAWLHENAGQYGLIPEENGPVIRLRYVGPVHAAAMRALGMEQTEYLRFLRRERQIMLRRKGRSAAWVFCVPEGEAVSFVLPEGAAWEISGDGAGFVIVAVRSGS